MKPDGYNPLRWRCEERGCFNEKQRPKIEMFCGAFPGRINFSDVDGIVEVAGNALMLEWKSAPMSIPTGQRIMYERLSRGEKVTVLCLAGSAQTMEVTHMRVFFNGKQVPSDGWTECDFAGAVERMRRWAKWARDNPKFGAQGAEG